MEGAGTERRLAAVMSADVAGYARLMADDERATLATLTAYRAVIAARVIEGGGRIVDSPGDAWLAEFGSPVEAVASAVAVQEELGRRNADLPERRRMAFRIGINLGDVLVQDGALYGDAVNVAARLEALADPGGISVSGTIFDHVDGKLPVAFRFLGAQRVKNIDRPVRVYHVDASPEQGATRLPGAAADAGKPVVAVLPFDAMGGEREQGYFADGITEDIITELSRFSELHVIARNSVFTFKGRPVKIQEVGRELGADYVLEGSVRKSGRRVRVTAQLIDAASGHHVWADRFDEDLEDVFAVQDEVTAKIVATLVGRVEASERERVRRQDRTGEPRAYDLLLRGRDLWQKVAPDSNREARKLYEQALEIDPAYARAHASLAWTYFVEAEMGWVDDSDAALEEAARHARQGIAADPDAHSSYLVLGQTLLRQGRAEQAIVALETARRIAPNDADAHAFLAFALGTRGEASRALSLIDRAFVLNPTLGRWHQAVRVMLLVLARRHEAAIEAFHGSQDPWPAAYRWAAVALAHLGRIDEARGVAAALRRLPPDADLMRRFDRLRLLGPDDRAHYLEGLRLAGIGTGTEASFESAPAALDGDAAR